MLSILLKLTNHEPDVHDPSNGIYNTKILINKLLIHFLYNFDYKLDVVLMMITKIKKIF